MTEAGSAKFLVKEDGDSVVQQQGELNEREIRKIQFFIKNNYQDMYIKWMQYSREGFYKGK